MRYFLILLTLCCTQAVAETPSGKKKKCPAEKPKAQLTKAEKKIPLFQREAEFPADAKAGECYVRVRRPAEYKTVEERVVVHEASVRYEVTPAVFRNVKKMVMVRPETKRYEVVPAKFEQKMVEVIKQPEHKKLAAVAAKFVPVKERVETRAGRVLWKKGTDPLAEVKGIVGNVWCLVRDNALFEDYTWQKLTDKARVDEDLSLIHI